MPAHPSAPSPAQPAAFPPAEAKALSFAPKILFLSCSADVVERSLRGEPLRLDEALPLRDDVSTDEITPLTVLVHYDEQLGRYPYTGFRAGEAAPVAADAVRGQGIEVVVAGRRYGKGSSREHSPQAEKIAGVRLVIAESFERIYRQNADNIGLFTSTDFGLIERIRKGEPIPLADLVAGRDALAAAILESGGLLRFGQRFMHEVAAVAAVPDVPAVPAETAETAGLDPQPRTLFEKIVARHALAVGPAGPMSGDPAAGEGAFVRADWRFIHEYYTGMAAHMLHAAFGQQPALRDPGSIIVFEDHTSYVEESPAHLRGGLVPAVHRMVAAQREFAASHALRMHRTLTEAEALADDGSHIAGISHAMVAERYALPGQLIVGTDSHTPHSGALGCVAFGVGTTDMANAFVTGAVRFTMPQSLRIVLDGRLAEGVTAKDLALHLLALPFIRAGGGLGKVFEFTGEAVARLGTDERATLTNMTAELGGFTGIVAPDEETQRFLRERRGIDFALEPWMRSDEGAAYAQTLHVDCAEVAPMVARPGDPGQGLALAQLGAPVRIDIAYGGSCTAGKREDFDHYHAVLRWAADRGLKVAPGVQLFLQFGTTAVRDHCVAAGYMDAFLKVGARMLQPSCGACGNCGPGGSVSREQVTVSAINRNFPGRGGPGEVWLASPPTVAASAIAGELISFEGLRARHVHERRPAARPSPPSIDLQTFDAAIVDLDGTMVHTLGDFVAALDAVLDALGLPRVAAAEVAAMVGKGSEHLIRSVLRHVGADPALYERAWQLYQHHYAAINGRHSTVYDGVVEGLSALRRRGLRLACLTNKPTAFAQALLADKGLAGFFDAVFGGDAFERKKPDPLPLLRTCEALGSVPARTLMIGDSSNDARAARAAGCSVLLVSYGYNHGEPVRGVDADGYLDSLAELDDANAPAAETQDERRSKRISM